MGKLDKVEKFVEKGKEEALLKLARDKDREVRLAAIAGMGKIGRDDSFNLLIELLSDKEAAIRAGAACALGEMGNGHADAQLRHRLESEQDETVIRAIKDAIPKVRNER